MSMFLIRIELHHETNYDPLHAAMARRGMTRFITGSDSRVYRLPTGTYYHTSTSSAAIVHATASAAAAEVGHKNPSVIVADTNSCRWSGLEIASAHEQRMGA